MIVLTDVDNDAIVHVYDGDELVALPKRPSTWGSIVSFDEQYRADGLPPSPGDRLTTTWLGPDALVRVRDAFTGEELFAAAEFTQRADGDSWVFRDTVSGAEARHCSPVVQPDQRSSLPARLRAAVRPVGIDVFLAGVAHLRALFTASVQTGRPVFWH
ncbi:hypothetical protein [Dactylosporangium sp. NPDC048998]|uniref:hypothetical protein n=1 Tax=Dactylosporangium sp. NPDC048998 TaxID=3363976 RepID=UPI0037210C58